MRSTSMGPFDHLRRGLVVRVERLSDELESRLSLWTVLRLQGFDASGIGTLRFFSRLRRIASHDFRGRVGGGDATEEGKPTGSNYMCRAQPDQIINMKHELVQLAGKVDWDRIDGQVAPLYSVNGLPGIGRP